MRTLRARLFVYVAGGAAGLILLAGALLTWTMAGWLQAEFDRGLEAKVRALVALTEEEAGRIEFDFEPALMPEFADAGAPEYFELWRPDGTLFARSPSFGLSDRALRGALVRGPEPAPAPAFQDLVLPDGRRGRQVRIDFTPRVDVEEAPDGTEEASRPGPGGRPTATLIVARQRERLDADLRRLTVGVGVFALALVLALAGLTHAALGVGLRSLARLTGQVRALDAASLGTRVRVEAPPEEVAVVVEQVNALLDRLEAAFRRERQLSSDVAHELKTPVAELRALCEVGARWPEDREAVRGFFRDAHAIALQMERIVVNLLALARCDEGREPVRTAPVAAAAVVEAAWRPLAGPAAARGLQYRSRVPPDLRLQTDPDKLGLMVANILANAVAYGMPGTTILCTATGTDGRARIRFSNRAENLEPGDLDVMFDRFWRKDPARTDGHHVGLGLALVRALADLLAIEVTTHLDADRVFSITLGVPVADARGPGGPGPDGPAGPPEAGQNRTWASTPTPQAALASGKAGPGKK